MKLSEIKKLKVPELRARLEELGLDTKGLKAELVGRLWSAFEAGLQKQSSDRDSEAVPDSGEEVKTKNDSPARSPTATETDVASPGQTIRAHLTVTSTSSPLKVDAPLKPRSTMKYTDTGTQTEPEMDVSNQLVKDGRAAGLELPNSGLITQCRSKLESHRTGMRRQPLVERQTVNDQNSGRIQELPVPEHTEHHKTPQSPVSKQASEGTTSRHGPVSQPQGEEMARGEEEETGEELRRPSVVLDEMGRGRAFYEFKEEIRYKRAKSPQPQSERDIVEEDPDRVKLDPYTGDLHFEVGPDGSCGQPRFWARFPLLWSGCRLTHGVRRGRVGFEVRLDRKLSAQAGEEQAEDGGRDPEPYGLRVGWSVGDTSLLLGEEDLSYGYDGRGKKVSSGKGEEFGEPFSESDVIGCYVSFSTDGAVELSFHKNGQSMGVAFCLGPSVLRGRALFPHVLCKSCSIQLHLDPTASPWYPSPPGCTPLAALPAGDRVRAPLPPTSTQQCEVVVMVGLPGSGKTHWARAYMKQQPEKRFTLLGTEALLACMISGGRRESRLQQASQCLTQLIKMAPHFPGNYILDQINVLFSARRHKLQLFRAFGRCTVVVVFPAAEEWRRRLKEHQRQEGEEIPETALLKLQVSCSLPEQQGELFDELHYVELPQEQAQALLQEYREEARSLLPPVPKRARKKPRLHQNRLLPHSPTPTQRSQWNGRWGWNGTRPNQLTYHHNKPYWGAQPRNWNSGYQDQGFYNSRSVGFSSYQGYW